MLRPFWFRVRALFRRGKLETELQEELRYHLELEAAKNRQSGMEQQAAMRLAETRFGPASRVREACREERGTRWAEELLRDLRQGFRLLRRSPAFAFTAVASLALGIGANTAIFAVIDAVILKPLPLRDPDSLVMIWETMPRRDVKHNVVSPGNFLDWQKQSVAFAQMAAIDMALSNLTGVEMPREVHGQFVTAELFSLLGAQPAVGRLFNAEEARAEAKSIVLSDRFARQRFGSVATALGRTVELDRRPWQVIGVMPPAFEFLDAESDFWRPWYLNPAQDYRRSQGRFMRAVARLKPGVTLEMAQTDLQAIARQLEVAHPEFDKGWSVALTSYREEISGNYRMPLYLLMGAVLLVLLIACVNVANLLCARAGVRRRELGIRTSLGAGRVRLARQMLAESLLLALLGAIPGCLLAMGALAVFRQVAPPSLHGLAAVGIDWRILAFTGLLSLAATVVFGVGPALMGSRNAPAAVLHDGARTAGSTGRSYRLPGLLVAIEFALAVVLIVGSGLLLKSFHMLRSVDTGFSAEHVLTARILLPAAYDASRSKSFFSDAARRLEVLSGVSSVSAVSFLPFGGLRPGTSFSIGGRPDLPKDQRPITEVRAVLPGYFRTLGIPLVKGRDFYEGEGSPQRPAFLINSVFARTHWPEEDPIGRTMTVSMGRTPMPGVIVGVVGDTKDKQLNGVAVPTVYYSHPSFPISYMSLVIRAKGEPAILTKAVVRTIRAIDPHQPVVDIQTMDQMLSRSVSPQRFQAILMGTFAGIALLLAAVGIYGVSAYAVAQRTAEIGIRMALGATRGQVVGLIAKEGSVMVCAGLVLGVIFALAMRATIASFLFGVAPADPAIFGMALLILAVVALLAITGPARRAARINPVTAIRGE